MKKSVFLALAICVFVVVGATYFSVSRHSEVQTYTDQDHGFCIDLIKDQFITETTSDAEVTEILFMDKNIHSNYPEWIGTVFAIIVYDKDVVKGNPFDVLDGPKYLGESDRSYYGIYMPTDVNYPPNELEAVNHYQELSKFARDYVAESFTVLVG